MSMATITNAGRAVMALAIANETIHIAWGSGDEDWDKPNPTFPNLVEAQTLINELGRRSPATINFVLPDELGDIVIPIGQAPDGTVQSAKYKIVTEPTPYLYIRTNFDNSEASNAIIREIGVFIGTITKPTLPPGQRYFLPDDLDFAGRLLAWEIVRPSFPRSASVRESYEFVLPI